MREAVLRVGFYGWVKMFISPNVSHFPCSEMWCPAIRHMECRCLQNICSFTCIGSVVFGDGCRGVGPDLGCEQRDVGSHARSCSRALILLLFVGSNDSNVAWTQPPGVVQSRIPHSVSHSDIWGRQDKIIPVENASFLRDQLPNCHRLDILDQAGHSLNLETPGRIFKVGFLPSVQILVVSVNS